MLCLQQHYKEGRRLLSLRSEMREGEGSGWKGLVLLRHGSSQGLEAKNDWHQSCFMVFTGRANCLCITPFPVQNFDRSSIRETLGGQRSKQVDWGPKTATCGKQPVILQQWGPFRPLPTPCSPPFVLPFLFPLSKSVYYPENQGRDRPVAWGRWCNANRWHRRQNFSCFSSLQISSKAHRTQ